ncbi:uncharacterized protein LOC142981858 [Anticarsia gemmatalis]|uniref:uncharacterized protein LOC142981858 n=1 Tax=Anticarsia gemmatalis TaxID=129554 RepID=UPI003F77265D
MIVAVNDCKSPSYPYVKDSPITIDTVIYNTSTTMLLSGNVTVAKNAKNVKYRMKGFIWENGKWRPNYIMNDIGCHGMLLHLMCVATGVKYDRKNCMFLKGTYTFKDLDANSMQHLWASKMEYGRILWKPEVFNRQVGTFFCKEFETLTEPA